MTSQRSLNWLPSTITICADGTTCENSSTCQSHPTKEGAYICDCASSPLSGSDGPFAGVYCEHAASSTCTSGSKGGAVHAFCTNGGECKSFVGKNTMHQGCKCPKGYTGEYCQFVEGSVPTDWEVLNYPSVAASRGGDVGGMASGKIAGIVMGSLMGCALAFAFLFMFVVTGKFAMRMPTRGDKEMDTNADGEHANFIGGRSVYIKRRSTKSAARLSVSAEMLEADGSTLTDAITEEKDDVEENMGESPKKELQEVNLEELGSSLDQDHKTDDVHELPNIS